VTNRIQLLPKQLEFITAQEREIGYSGAFGAGKTRALCIKAVSRVAGRPGAREAIVRKHLVTAKATTLRTLLDSDGDLPPVLPPETYVHRKSDKSIKLHGGGEIVYFGFDDPDKIGSYNLSGAGIDEVVELNELDYTQLRGRIRLRVDGLPNQIYWACNPGVPSHFIARRFGLAMGARAVENCRAIQTTSLENFFLPADYIKDLLTFEGLRKKRYVYGQWVGSEGLVYDNWNRETHVRERSGPWARVIFGVDYGYRNPFAAVKVGIDGDDRAHVIEEYYSPGMQAEEMVEKLVGMGAREADYVLVDPSAPQLIERLIANDIPSRGGDNAVEQGISEVRQRLAVLGDGHPGLTVDPSCEAVQREFETYEHILDRATGTYTDRPLKKSDHAMDALRLVCMDIRSEDIQVW
jgi:phage terminase large subunit